MKLLTSKQRAQLIRNGRPEYTGKDHPPIVKLFVPGTACTWLLSEINWDDDDIAFGLCDLGMGFPELGSVGLHELETLRTRFVLGVERDLLFKPSFPMSVYVDGARKSGGIIDDEDTLRTMLAIK